MCSGSAGMSWRWVCLPGTESSQTAQDKWAKGANVLVSISSNLLFQFLTRFTEQRTTASCLRDRAVLIFCPEADLVLSGSEL